METLKLVISLCCLLLLCAATVSAAEDRAAALMRQIRCVTCTAQSIADSDAPLAADLRREVAARVAAGDDDAAIKHSLRARYGDQVLLEPPLRADTLPLWAAPLFLLMGAAAISWRLFKRRHAR